VIGARPSEVMVADSTSVNLFKLIAAALRLPPRAPHHRLERENFPTDLMSRKGWSNCSRRPRIASATPETLDDVVGDDVALVMLTHVNYAAAACTTWKP